MAFLLSTYGAYPSKYKSQIKMQVLNGITRFGKVCLFIGKTDMTQYNDYRWLSAYQANAKFYLISLFFLYFRI